uniref:Uncharacterized protein n=1 Tax=Panagrolaimus superbus TaxID=310955 RepID=A0A914Y9Q0_9BILA
MIAFVANAKFMGSGKSDTVVAGGENASILARAIGAQHWPLLSINEYLIRSKVVFGAAIKRLIYFPNGELFFHPESNFAEATKIMLESIEMLADCNDVKIMILPVLRHCGYPDISQKFIAWFKEQSKDDDRFIGDKEIDEKKLVNWINATPRDTTSTEYVNDEGIATKAGIKRLGEYLNQLGDAFKVNVAQERFKNDQIQSESNGSVANGQVNVRDKPTSSSVWTNNSRDCHSNGFKTRGAARGKPQTSKSAAQEDCSAHRPAPYYLNKNRGRGNYRGR